MAGRRKLGINFGSDALDLIEIEKQDIVTHCHVPYLEVKDRAEVVETIDEIKLAAILQKNLRDKRIETDEIFATVPSKEVLLRTFLIPYLPSAEIKTAINFEARKFVPIKLDMLYYDYLTRKTKDKEAKKLKAHFVAIKREVMDKFVYALDNSNLKTLSIETSPFSLQRLLLHKKLIKPKSNIILIEASQKEGNVSIVEGGFPQLIRDFKLSRISKDVYANEPESLSVLLNKEVRLSFDYYLRQSPKAVIDKIFLFTNNREEQLRDNLSKEFNIPAELINASEILNLDKDARIGVLKAYGAAIRSFVSTPTKIDLFRKRKVEEAKERVGAEFKEIPVDKMSLIRTSIIAAVFILLFYLFVDFSQISTLNQKLKKLTQKRMSLKHKSGVSDLVGLLSLKSDYEKRIESLKKSKNYIEASLTTPLLNILPSLVPDGVWLNSMDLRMDQQNLEFRLVGMAYLESEMEQSSSVNSFLNGIKESKQFQESFDIIDLDFIKQKTVDEFPVTEFSITCR